VTELTQSFAAVRGRRAVAKIAHEHEPSFTELVYAHFAWWRGLRNGGGPEAGAATYHDLARRFERSHGRVVHSYWCSHVESAVALTERRRRFPFRARFGFHRESDWATKHHPEIAAELHRCDELAVRARTVLTGVRQHICLQLIAASAAHLLSLVDSASAHEAPTDTKAALDRERVAIERAQAYYRQAANGQAQIVYFAGMATITLVIALAATLALAIEWTTGVAALIAGAAGAVVSVIQRINAGHFELDYDVGRPYAFFLGGLRPLIGGALALAISFAFSSGILHLPISSSDPDANHRLAVVVVGFLSGFSERWAQDTLTTALPKTLSPANEPEKTTPPA
jgi:hypothetical protein